MPFSAGSRVVSRHAGSGGTYPYFEGMDAPGRADGVMIGYPGPDHVVTDGRGVLRAKPIFKASQTLGWTLTT